MVRRSRFQFVDLAGSERLKDAHRGQTNFRSADGSAGELMSGVMNNYSLMMLSTCAREVVRCAKLNRRASFKAYLVDLTLLLQASMTGNALTACFVCLSQAPANTMQSKYALDF